MSRPMGRPEDQHDVDRRIRLFVFTTAAETGHIPQPDEIAVALDHPRLMIEEGLLRLAAGRALILAPNSTNIWAADPFCATPSAFQVTARGRYYFGICIWDALGIPAALASDGSVDAACGDCGDRMRLEIRNGELIRSEGVVHFGVPAARFWDNIAFT